MKKWFLPLFLMLAALALIACNASVNQPATPSGQAQDEAQVIGTVNGENVYRYEYNYYLNMYFNEYFNNYYESLLYFQGVDLLDEESSRELLGNLENYAWQSVLQSETIRQMARDQYSLTLEPAYYDEFLLPAYTLGINTNRLYSQIYPLIQQEATAAKVITDDEARTVYEEDPAAWDCRQAAHIIISTADLDEAGKAAAKAKAEDILAQLNAGADFGALAGEFSEDATKDTAGQLDLYFNSAGGGISDSASSFDPIFAAATFSLENIGDYTTEPVESSFGYHIIKLTDKKEGFEAVKDYLISNMQTVSDDEVSALLQQKVDAFQADATIERKLEFKYFTEAEAEPELKAEPEQPAQ